MIAALTGSIIIRDDPYIILDVNGVGYRVLAASDVLSSITELGAKLSIFTYTHVREDMLELYGFSKYTDLKLFESLINVSGVGPKTAIAIFSIGTAEQIMHAITQADTSFFSQVPRLGTKNAQKIIIELKNKIGGGELDLTNGSIDSRKELASALKSFGFTSSEINEAVRSVDSAKTTEEQIKLALKLLGR